MTNNSHDSNTNADSALIAAEQAKRARHSMAGDPDVMLRRLADSPGYRSSSTPAGRIRMQQELLKIHGPVEPSEAS